VANLEKLGVVGIVLEGAEDLEIDRFCERMIGALESHDESRGGELVATLRTYLDCNGNARKAARELNIHINTIRHRLANIEALTARDLDDPEVRLNFHVALRLAASRAMQPRPNGTGLSRRPADRMSAE
jgi:DNA-binding PucR family transcriptional regulator